MDDSDATVGSDGADALMVVRGRGCSISRSVRFHTASSYAEPGRAIGRMERGGRGGGSSFSEGSSCGGMGRSKRGFEYFLRPLPRNVDDSAMECRCGSVGKQDAASSREALLSSTASVYHTARETVANVSVSGLVLCHRSGPGCLPVAHVAKSRPASSAEYLCTWLCSVLPLYWVCLLSAPRGVYVLSF